MSNKGCYHGCIHKKEIKVAQMKDLYEFRCAIQNKYMSKEDVKIRCNLFEGRIKIKEYTIDEFLD